MKGRRQAVGPDGLPAEIPQVEREIAEKTLDGTVEAEQNQPQQPHVPDLDHMLEVVQVDRFPDMRFG